LSQLGVARKNEKKNRAERVLMMGDRHLSVIVAVEAASSYVY
jgi:hypothetical protein